MGQHLNDPVSLKAQMASSHNKESGCWRGIVAAFQRGVKYGRPGGGEGGGGWRLGGGAR